MGVVSAPLILLCALAAGPVVGVPAERLAGLSIEKIDIRAPENEDIDALLALTGLSAGKPYAASEIRRAVKLLYQLDRFENVYVSASRSVNSVNLEIVLPPRPRVRDVRVESIEELLAVKTRADERGRRNSRWLGIRGNDLELSESEVEEAIGLKTGAELDERRLGAKREQLEVLYRRIGYRSPAIGIATERVGKSGDHDILIRIDQGPRTRLGNVRYEGELHRPEWAISSFLSLDRGEYLDLRKLAVALEDLENDYRARGYYEVSVGEPQVTDTERELDGEPVADLLVPLNAGPHVSVRFVGNQAVSRRELYDAAAIMRESPIGAGQAAIAEVKERILARYERRGFWRAKVESRVRTSPDGSERDIVFFLNEGPASYVASIQFVGTTTTADESSLRSEKRLLEKLYQVVEETLSEVIGGPGADPETVGLVVGDHSLARRPRDSDQPDTTSPNLKHVYVPRAYKAAADAIADLYRAEGHQTVEVVTPTISERPNSSLVDVKIEIRPGVRWQLGAMAFSGNEAVPSGELLNLSGMDPGRQGGEPLSFYNVDEASRAMVAYYKNQGYLYARVSEDLREVPPRGSLAPSEFVSTSTSGPLNLRRVCAAAEASGKANCDVELVFKIVEGPQVKTRNVVIRGVESTRESLVRGELAVREGEILRESDMLSTRANLLRIGVFERVAVHPIDEKNEGAEKDVVCEVRERKHESFELGAGASTAEGVRAFATYAHQNLLGTALRLQVNGKVNVQPFLILYEESVRQSAEDFYATFNAAQRIEREVAVGVAFPQIFGLPRGFGAGLDVSYARDNDPAFAQDAGKVTLSGTYTGFRPELWNKARPITFQLRTIFDLSQLTCNPSVRDESPQNLCSEEAFRVKGLSTYLSGGPVLRIDLRDDALDPRDGAYFDLSGAYANGLDANSPDFVNLEGRVSLYFPLPGKMSFAFSLFAARVFNLQPSLKIPVNRKIFAGGSSTIRGYTEGSLFPRDYPKDITKRISTGGLFVAALKNEFRFPISGALSGALFWDLGDLYEDTADIMLDFDLRQGVGAGLRVATPVGPLTVDFAVPLILREEPGEKPGLNIHFSVRSF